MAGSPVQISNQSNGNLGRRDPRKAEFQADEASESPGNLRVRSQLKRYRAAAHIEDVVDERVPDVASTFEDERNDTGFASCVSNDASQSATKIGSHRNLREARRVKVDSDSDEARDDEDSNVLIAADGQQKLDETSQNESGVGHADTTLNEDKMPQNSPTSLTWGQTAVR